MKARLSRARARISGRYALITALVLVLGIPAVSLATGEGRPILGGKRNPNNGELARETQIIADNSSYGTRQSNVRNGDGGGAIYGCRSNPGSEPCIRSNNLQNGRAFEFETKGNQGGSIQLGDANGAPFTTNAKGTVTNFSADLLDGRDSTSFASSGDLLFADVGGNGALGNNRGATGASVAGNTYTVTFNRDVSKCSFTAAPVGDPMALAVAPGPGATQAQVVKQAAAAPGFHLQVIC